MSKTELFSNGNNQPALIIEGGAMRGIFAAGVLDCFMANDFRPFHSAYGVSSGSTNMASYLAGQPGRNRKIITDLSCRPDFINAGKFLRGGHYIDLDWLWQVVDKEHPLDTRALSNQPTAFYAVVTNVVTGKPEYLMPAGNTANDLLKASCAVPIAYRRFPRYGQKQFADGGIGDSIPVIEAYNRGARHIVVVLSRSGGYRKSPVKTPAVVRKVMKDYPMLAEAILQREQSYNRAIDFIESPPEDCRLEVISPSQAFKVSRTTTNAHKLANGYNMGFRAAEQFLASTPLFSPVTMEEGAALA
ncbi:patatin-like phospholipase family protein [Reinekea marinisedimentorum]|uniref:Putative patatin/cPLA2 family phospholipase n=1 Tax=Reinekea marinisedimentorum TaxID=230495 RepID=A0A4R3I062_9GAMM|nr:patatin family protein [Reinekea marinisedimentorum]TCS38912.1 putative patatin/cPLA2 family phospholipase [Reinekea marinisedimentorum]